MNTETDQSAQYSVWDQNRHSEPLRPRRLHTPILFYVTLLLIVLGTAAIRLVRDSVSINFWLSGLVVIFVGVAMLVIVNQILYARTRRRHSIGSPQVTRK